MLFIMKMRTLIVPEYVPKFQCLGGACEDTCCKGWSIAIDKPTYLSYRKLKNPRLKKRLLAIINRDRRSTSDRTYAKMNLNESGYCPLYTEDGWCGLQQEAGVEMLPSLCIEYPRAVNVVQNVYERSMTLSCPEVTRLVLLNEHGLSFTEIEEPSAFELTRNYKISDPSTAQLLWSLRIASIRILQNRSASLENRLIVLGLFLQAMESLSLQEQLERVEELAHQYELRLTVPAFIESLEQLPTNLRYQLKMGRELLAMRLEKFGVKADLFQSIMSGVVGGLRLEEELPDEARVEVYETAYQEYYKPYMDEHEYMMENYLVNHIFKEVFPLKSESYFTDFRELVTNYALLKFLLVGTAATFKGLNEKVIVQVFYGFSRSIEHNATYKKMVNNLLDAIGCQTMGHMVTLIKN
ncbi:MAG TPA: flagellin lysine-N-methylase [Savagea sp.]